MGRSRKPLWSYGPPWVRIPPSPPKGESLEKKINKKRRSLMTSIEVNAWFESYDNPMKDVVQRVREIIMESDERMDETIKWQAPTFTFNGNLASFFPRSKKHASLMFHTGAEIPGDFPNLEGDGEKARTMKFADLAEAEARKEELELIVIAWIELKS